MPGTAIDGGRDPAARMRVNLTIRAALPGKKNRPGLSRHSPKGGGGRDR
jgi:hypothetical protein